MQSRLSIDDQELSPTAALEIVFRGTHSVVGRQAISNGVVLLIDDSCVAAKTCTRIMNALGFEVVTFSVAMEGIEALVSLQHDVVLVVLDVVMPSLDGIECMSIIREHPVVCNIPIYILSGVEDLHILNLCVENGANGIVSKPLRMETFRSISSLHGLQRGGRGIDDIHHRYPRCSEMCNNTLTCSCLLPELKLPQPLISRPSADERSSHSSRVSNYTGPPFSFILLDSNYQQYSFPSTQQTIKRTNTYLVLLPSICCIRLYERDGCMRYIKDLHDELIYNGDEVLCISADLPDALAVAKQLLSLPCDLLSDPGLSVGRLLLGDIDEYDATKVGIVYLNADGDIIYKWCSAVGFPTTILAWRAMSAATLLRGKDSVSSSGVVDSESLNSEDDQGMYSSTGCAHHEQLAVTVVEPEEAVTVTGVKDCIILATLTGDAEATEKSFAGDNNGPGNSTPPLNEVVQLVDESPKRREVLVVDDSKMFSKLASSQLEMLGYYVTTTDNGQLAYDIVRGCHPHRFSAILVDLVMPVCDGIEFVQLLRSNDLYSAVPVIIWSGLSIDELSRACQSLRGVHLMSKHGGVDSLVTMIRNAVS